MKLVTFNIRCDFQQDGDNNFQFRQPLILEKIRKEHPDVICFQEVRPHVAKWLRESLPDYYLIGCGRDKDFGGEQVPIAYRKDSFQLLRAETFWLSETPLMPGSRYPEQSDLPRICTEAVFQDFHNGHVFRVLNTHFDHEGSSSRLRAAKQILRRVCAYDFCPEAALILCGDLNALPDDPEIRMLVEDLTYLTPDTGITFHNYGGEGQCQIDYLFGLGDLDCVAYGLWQDSRDGVWLSDHYPVWAEILL